MLVTLSAVSGVAIISLGLVLTPGPNMIYLVTRSLSQGRRAGLISLIGVAAALAVYLVATTLGLGIPRELGTDDVVGLLSRNIPGYQVTNPRDPAAAPPSRQRPLPFEQVY